MTRDARIRIAAAISIAAAAALTIIPLAFSLPCLKAGSDHAPGRQLQTPPAQPAQTHNASVQSAQNNAPLQHETGR